MDSQGKSVPQIGSLPPKIPGTTEQLLRVICLLGNRTKAELKKKAQLELIDLIGVYPSSTQATAWKQYLRQLSKANR